jgi:glucose-6-phosphate 1-dehydrogenase
VGLTEPDMRLSTRLNGPERTAEIPAAPGAPAPPRFPACAHLIRHMLNSDPMLFIRGDQAEEAWRIIGPVLNAGTAGDFPLQEYPAGHEDHAVGAPEGPIPGTGKVSEDRRGGR